MNLGKFAAAVALVAVLAGCGAHTDSASADTGGYGGHHRGGMLRAVQRLDLTSAQKTKIDKIASDYRTAHPQGSPRDPQAMRQERQAIMNVLTPAQRAQLRQNH